MLVRLLASSTRARTCERCKAHKYQSAQQLSIIRNHLFGNNPPTSAGGPSGCTPQVQVMSAQQRAVASAHPTLVDNE
jgi:hypothetical protein